jgi:protein tyrosine phosphatase (PTP) superfamily phosphohydrolase (DUF442 family)
MNIDKSYNFRRLSERLTTSGLVRPDALSALASQGYDVVVNLLPESHEHAVRNERELLEAQGIEYVLLPVDFRHPTQSDYVQFSEALDRVGDRKAHIHCAANMRVSAFYALREFTHKRWSVDQARNFIRNIWQPADHPGWPEFIAEVIGNDAARQILAPDSEGAAKPASR